MNTIPCKYCKAEILLLPDLKAMAKAIRSHAQTHHRWSRDRVVAELTKQLLIAAADPDTLQLLDETEKQWVNKRRGYITKH